ncbi:unnamed protein product [Triticum turgidum subsp. durum]|uniref:Uncharacterized protein n=1 Tax=Triticum turgidum subsp. durum TaxID=4567 RepID=A0A9R1AP79_TRITD|nr:unnamed protein product [Triticum turgidum subsp. durum]
MDHRLVAPLLVLLGLLLSPAPAAAAAGDEEPLIRQVVGAADPLDNDLELDSQFLGFVQRFGKTYRDAEEHAHRLSVFKANLRRARRHQMLDPSAEHGVTKFSDLTPAEFRRTFLGLKTTRRSFLREMAGSAHDAPVLPTDGLPEDFDWRDHGCDPAEPDSCDAGCNGGLMTSAFSYLLKSGGLEREKDYPYTGKDGTCKFEKSKVAASVQNFSVVAVDEEQIAANLVKYGPLAIGINAAYMQTYIGGVSCPYICGRHLDHGVLLVGYGASGFAPSRFKEKPYWIIKNSWGENWGDKGYYKICRGSNVRNKCGVDSMVSTVSAMHASKEE